MNQWNERMTRKTPAPPRLELLERCWRLRTVVGGQEVVCGIFQTDAGLEVRAGFRDDLLQSQRAIGMAEARAVATECRRTLVEELGGVEELPLIGENS